MRRRSVGERRLELAEHQRDVEREQRHSTCDGASGCMGDRERQVPDDVDSTHAGSHVCEFHYKSIMGRLKSPDDTDMTPRERIEWWEETHEDE